MFTVIVANVRRRGGPDRLLFCSGILFATTGFTVLTGSTVTVAGWRVQGGAPVKAHARGAFDILVRPKGTRTALEAQRGLVRANFVAGLSWRDQHRPVEADQRGPRS